MSETSDASPIHKLKMHSPDLTAQNVDKIAALFPVCVTEATSEDGTLRRAIDFDLLRQELSDSIVEGPQERYHLDWPGKRQALITANAPIAKTLRPVRDESVDFDTTLLAITGVCAATAASSDDWASMLVCVVHVGLIKVLLLPPSGIARAPTALTTGRT